MGLLECRETCLLGLPESRSGFRALDTLTNSGKRLISLSFYGFANPTYRIHEYRSDFYKVVKFKGADRTAVSLVDHSKDEHYDHKLDPSYSRARSVVLQLALCNSWEYFFTGTIDGKLRSRYDLFSFLSHLVQWFLDLRKSGIPILYLLVPERHENGAWHIHGLLAGLPAGELTPFVSGLHPQKLVDKGYLNWPGYAQRFGFCSLGRLVNNIGAAFYVTKYISKELAGKGNSGVRCRLYTSSRGLDKAHPLGDVYGNRSELDRFLDRDYDFCKTGFVRCKEFSDVVDLVSCIDDGAFEELNLITVTPDPGCPEWEQMILYGFSNRGVVDPCVIPIDGS